MEENNVFKSPSKVIHQREIVRTISEEEIKALDDNITPKVWQNRIQMRIARAPEIVGGPILVRKKD